MQMLNSTHTLVSPTPTTLRRYLLEFESSMSVSFVSEYSRWYSRSPLHLDFVEETPVALQVDFRHVKKAADPRKRIILGHN